MDQFPIFEEENREKDFAQRLFASLDSGGSGCPGSSLCQDGGADRYTPGRSADRYAQES